MRSRRSHHSVLIGCFVLALLLPAGAGAGKKNTGTRIRDLYYGEVLYQFYKQDDFRALTHLLAAREAGRLPHHAAEAELLLGGLYLEYGQHEQAGEIFARLLNEATDPAVRDRAWLYVGKARYERGQFVAADDAFARVGDALPPGLAAEHRMLRAQSLMAQERFGEAAALLDGWNGTQQWLAYANYNLGVALVRMQQLEAGAARLDLVGRTTETDTELLALRDKANLALGFGYLQAQRPTLAKPVLERVRINGPFSNKALLGVGWAATMLEDYRGALNPWLVLQDRDVLDSAVQESLLAVPYAFNRLGARGSAAEHYLAAMSRFEDELTRLDDAIFRARSGVLLPALLAHDDVGIGHWYWNLEKLPDTDDARYLYHLIANHRFQEALRSYRDLLALRDHLSEWQQKLDTFEHMVETRRLAYAQRLPEVEARFAEADIAGLMARRDGLAARLAMIERDRDIVALAEPDEARRWADITALETSAALSLDAGARDRHRILKGTLLWQLDAAYRYRLWREQRELAELDRRLERAREYDAAVRLARTQMPVTLDRYARRIATLAPRLASMQAQIGAALGDQERELTLIATTELEAQKSRLASYRVQARFALATIYDQATVAGQGVDAAAEAAQ